ncbi:hypothetical protein QEZ52_17670 [Aliisedimentitalea scapharcae]|uniref:HNH endonuclease n=1 Tax=Aliisedimentitalea scapharcae TaxID=1524259 RepID=A0ABZ2XU72_9RHOB
MKKARAKAIFNAGSRAIECLGINDGKYYCPICGEGFTLEAGLLNRKPNTNWLTEEDVPPKSVGGKVVILTCRLCNNSAGHNYEFDLVRRRNMVEQAKCLVGQQDGEFGHVIFKVGGLSLNANLSRRNGITHFDISDKNNLSHLEVSKDTLSEFQDGDTLSISPPKGYQKENIEKADLKSAFLAVAAKFGYSIAFDSRMIPLRKAIIGRADHKDLIHYMDFPPEISDKILVDEEAGVAAMKIEDRGVVIPWPSHPLSNFRKRGDWLEIRGALVEFPTGFEALVDRSRLKKT